MKATLPLWLLGFTMTACVYNEELAEMTDLNTANKETTLSYSMPAIVRDREVSEGRSIPSDAFAPVSIRIRNQMPDFHLTIESIRLCNIHLTGTYHFNPEAQVSHWETDTTRSTIVLETGHLQIAPNEEMLFPQEGSIPFIPQSVKAWNPIVLPQNSKGCYLLLNCKVFNEVTIWGNEKGNCAEAAIPLSVHFQSNEPSVIILTLAPNCPWYSVQGSNPQPLFVPITFDVSVEDWTE